MKLIVGLGNPGEKYKSTRHNIGFMAIELLASEKDATWTFEKKFNSEVAKFDDIILAKPHTFMNKSGEAVRKLVDYYNIDLDNLVIIHDDVDLEEGQTRFKKGSSSAGHHGIDDIIAKLGSQDFWRLRIGVGRPENDRFEVGDYVLSPVKLDLTTILNQLENTIGHK